MHSKGLSRVFSNTTAQNHQFFGPQQLSHPYMTTGKTIGLTRRTLVSKVISLLLNILSRLVITFLPSSKCLNLRAQEPRVGKWLEDMEPDFLAVKFHRRIKHKNSDSY